ncbi:MAG: shikimate kinase [Isosphaeraceae bacterium]
MTPEHKPRHRDPRGRGLALVGYRGTGKSTLGKILADRLRQPFLDADCEIEARAGRPITAIFALEGETAFRDWEEQTLSELVHSHPDAILATGGGAVLRESNRKLLLDFGLVVWLKAEPDELARRLLADPRVADRPALTPAGTIAEISAVLEARRAIYHEIADVEIDTLGRTPEQIADWITELWAL